VREEPQKPHTTTNSDHHEGIVVSHDYLLYKTCGREGVPNKEQCIVHWMGVLISLAMNKFSQEVPEVPQKGNRNIKPEILLVYEASKSATHPIIVVCVHPLSVFFWTAFLLYEYGKLSSSSSTKK
jgi:hypothetical protein